VCVDKAGETLKSQFYLFTAFGFPNESNDDFNTMLENIKKINFSKLHVFPYSKRDGTVSASLPQIDEQIKKDRAHTLLALSKELELNYMNKFINKKIEVLFERSSDEYSIGHTSNYLSIKVQGNYEPGSFKKVILQKIEYPYLIGKVVD